jgi:hypothetical protein
VVFGRDLITGSPPGPVRAARHKWRPARPLTSRRRASPPAPRCRIFAQSPPERLPPRRSAHSTTLSRLRRASHLPQRGGGGGGGGGGGERGRERGRRGCTAGVSLSALSDSKYNVPLYATRELSTVHRYSDTLNERNPSLNPATQGSSTGTMAAAPCWGGLRRLSYEKKSSSSTSSPAVMWAAGLTEAAARYRRTESNTCGHSRAVARGWCGEAAGGGVWCEEAEEALGLRRVSGAQGSPPPITTYLLCHHLLCHHLPYHYLL